MAQSEGQTVDFVLGVGHFAGQDSRFGRFEVVDEPVDGVHSGYAAEGEDGRLHCCS